jgi:hypothetical protein
VEFVGGVFEDGTHQPNAASRRVAGRPAGSGVHAGSRMMSTWHSSVAGDDLLEPVSSWPERTMLASESAKGCPAAEPLPPLRSRTTVR